MLAFSSPLARRDPYNCFEGSTERGLVREPCYQGHLRKGTHRLRQQLLSLFDALQNKVTVRGCPKRLPERPREMADR
jgi:hypothetical protein